MDKDVLTAGVGLNETIALLPIEPLDCCAYRKSNPGILMMQSAQNRTTENASGCLGRA